MMVDCFTNKTIRKYFKLARKYPGIVFVPVGFTNRNRVMIRNCLERHRILTFVIAFLKRSIKLWVNTRQLFENGESIKATYWMMYQWNNFWLIQHVMNQVFMGAGWSENRLPLDLKELRLRLESQLYHKTKREVFLSTSHVYPVKNLRTENLGRSLFQHLKLWMYLTSGFDGNHPML